jgi:hypothetical protein
MTAQAATSWLRDTPWRQSSVLTPDAVKALGLVNRDSPQDTCVVVVSHDCDLANDDLKAEPDVEVIAGRAIAANGSFMWGKSPRTLHLGFQRAGTEIAVELLNSEKQRVAKLVLAAFAPDPAFSLDVRGLSVLRSWLASRYRRAAFPDRFVDRLRSHKLDAKIEAIMKTHGIAASEVYFDVDKGQLLDRADGSPFELTIIVALVSNADPNASTTVAEAIEGKLEDAFRKKLFDEKSSLWTDIRLVGCVAMGEDDLPLSRVRVLTPWRLEHLSLKAQDGQSGPAT